jgi:hypothetical protein
MSIIRELHTRLSRLTWRETAKADEWSRPLTPIVGVGFMEEIRTIISDAIRTAFVDYPTTNDGSQWDQTDKELAECQMLANAVLIALNFVQTACQVSAGRRAYRSASVGGHNPPRRRT